MFLSAADWLNSGCCVGCGERKPRMLFTTRVPLQIVHAHTSTLSVWIGLALGDNFCLYRTFSYVQLKKYSHPNIPRVISVAPYKC